MTQLDAAQRIKLHTLLEHGYSKRAIARMLNTSTPTVCWWAARIKATGGVEVKKGRGRKCKVSAAAARTAGSMLVSGDYQGAASVAVALHKSGATSDVLHRTTVSRHAKQQAKLDGAPLKAKVGAPKKELKQANKEKRMEFCKKYTRKGWHNVMFTDRKKFCFRYPGAKVRRSRWVKAGQQERGCVQPTHPQTFNVYGGVTLYGVTKLHVVAGTTGYKSKHKNMAGKDAKNITTSEYKDVTAKTLLPEGSRIFGSKGISVWYYQQDNDPTHKRAIAASLKAHVDKGVRLLEGYPPNSPDLNPIENLWGIVGAEVDAMGCETFTEYRDAVVRTFKRKGDQLARHLVMSMKHRLRDCLATGGNRLSN